MRKRKVHLEKREKKIEKRLQMKINKFVDESSMARNVVELLILF